MPGSKQSFLLRSFAKALYFSNNSDIKLNLETIRAVLYMPTERQEDAGPKLARF
jgi:hypothetical protein